MSVFLTAKGQVLTCGIQDLTALSETECKLNRPCPVQGLDDIVDISVGAEHVLVLNKKGQVYGWGNNFSSQLGLDPDVHGDLVTKPILIPGNYFVFFKTKIIYRTRAIISRGLYIFYPHFSLRFIIKSVYNYCTKQGNTPIKSAVSNQERVILRVYGKSIK